MNERIRLLAEQAKKYALDAMIKITDREQALKVYSEAYDTKFAELIVEECVKCCEQVISDPVPESVDTWLNGGTQCINEIKQHFGVEE